MCYNIYIYIYICTRICKMFEYIYIYIYIFGWWGGHMVGDRWRIGPTFVVIPVRASVFLSR